MFCQLQRPLVNLLHRHQHTPRRSRLPNWRPNPRHPSRRLLTHRAREHIPHRRRKLQKRKSPSPSPLLPSPLPKPPPKTPHLETPNHPSPQERLDLIYACVDTHPPFDIPLTPTEIQAIFHGADGEPARDVDEEWIDITLQSKYNAVINGWKGGCITEEGCEEKVLVPP